VGWSNLLGHSIYSMILFHFYVKQRGRKILSSSEYRQIILVFNEHLWAPNNEIQKVVHLESHVTGSGGGCGYVRTGQSTLDRELDFFVNSPIASLCKVDFFNDYLKKQINGDDGPLFRILNVLWDAMDPLLSSVLLFLLHVESKPMFFMVVTTEFYCFFCLLSSPFFCPLADLRRRFLQVC